MEEPISDASGKTVVAALEGNFAERSQFQAGWPRMEIKSLPDVTRLSVSDVPSQVFNTVVGARFGSDTADARIAEITSIYRARNVAAQWWITPSSTPEDLATRLEAHGWVRDEVLPGMSANLRSLDLGAGPPAGLEIEEVRDAETILEWQRVWLDVGWPPGILVTYLESLAGPGFGDELPLRHFIGRIDGTPVSSSSVLLASGVAGLFGEGTATPWRRRGIGTAMALHAFRWAADRGHEVGVLVASEMGEPVYRRMGFHECCRVALYRLDAPRVTQSTKNL